AARLAMNPKGRKGVGAFPARGNSWCRSPHFRRPPVCSPGGSDGRALHPPQKAGVIPSIHCRPAEFHARSPAPTPLPHRRGSRSKFTSGECPGRWLILRLLLVAKGVLRCAFCSEQKRRQVAAFAPSKILY